MFKHRRTSNSVRTGAGLLVFATVLLVALGAVTTASAAPRVGTVTVAAQSGTLTEGAGGSVSYLVTVAKGNTFSLTADLTVTGLPLDVEWSFSPSSLVWGSFLPAGTTKVATLTITTTAATPAGAIPFTVKATRQGNGNESDSAIGTGTLTVLAAETASGQTIAFAPLADKAVGDANFTVSATASSGLTVSFAASGNCSVDSAAIVTLTGVGSCTITASQAGGSGFNAAPNVARTFSILAPDAVIIDLYATAGSTTIAGESIPVWGYNSATGPVSRPGGPTLVVTEDQPVTVRLHNQLGERTALLVNGLNMIPDLDGVAPGATKLYTFTPNGAGTYLYEAGLLPNAQHQSAMGLYGTLIVQPHDSGGNPITSRAYNDPSSAFDKAAVLVLSEIDPALNKSADPAAFDMRKYKPKYFLINGKAYPNTDPVTVAGGDRVLLRYVNAGIDYHSMAVLGAHQSVIALDGNELTYARRFVAETFGPGQTTDAIVVAPAVAGAVNRLAVYDASLLLHNSNTGGFGGMLTFLEVAAGSGGVDTTGPVTTGVAYASGTLTATISDATTGDGNVTAAEYYVDSTSGVGTPFGPFAPSVSVNVTAPVIVPAGQHTLYVRGRDSLGNWGAFSSVLVNGGDASGPTTKTPKLTPSSTNGTVPVAVHATGDDTATGGSNIAAADYTIDGSCPVALPLGCAMTVNLPAPVASLDATIPAAIVNALSALTPATPACPSIGSHVVSIRSRDSANNWGAPVTVCLVRVGSTGPTVMTPAGVVAAPNPNNGAMPINASSPAVRVTATLTSTSSNIAAAEAFLCTTNTACGAGGNGTGIPMLALDGAFNSPTEATYADIPLTTITTLSEGNHTIYVHGKDAAGSWGAASSTILVISRQLYFSTAGSTNPPGVGGTADDADIYFFNGGGSFSRSIDASGTGSLGLPGGANVDGFSRVDATHFYMSFTGNVTIPVPGPDLSVADEDVVYYNAGTWSLFFDGSANGIGGTDLDAISIVGSTLYFSTDDNDVMPGTSSPGDDADIYRWNGPSSFTRMVDASAVGWSTANVDGLKWVDATHVYLSYSTDTNVPGIGAVQDEDVVYKNGSTWFVYFDGTAFGLGTSGNLDIDAFDLP